MLDQRQQRHLFGSHRTADDREALALLCFRGCFQTRPPFAANP